MFLEELGLESFGDREERGTSLVSVLISESWFPLVPIGLWSLSSEEGAGVSTMSRAHTSMPTHPVGST